jgi:hypothetical protein
VGSAATRLANMGSTGGWTGSFTATNLLQQSRQRDNFSTSPD